MRALPGFLTFFTTLIYSAALYAQASADARSIETSQTFGNYEILFNAFPSTMLPAQIAAKHQFRRDKNIAFVNITLLKKTNGNSVTRAADLDGTVSDLMTSKPLQFRELRESDSIGYIAEVPFNNREVLRFDVKVRPQLADGETAPIGSPFTISFTRKFYTEQ